MNKKLKTYMDILYTLYDKYVVNREYKNRSFENDDIYNKEQLKLANEIEEKEALVKEEIKNVLKEVFPEIEIVAYDSRFLERGKYKLGHLLCKNTKDKEECRTIQKYFEAETLFLIIVQRFEDLDDDIKSIIENGEKEESKNE